MLYVPNKPISTESEDVFSLASFINGSSTDNVAVLTVVVSPDTTRLPAIVTVSLESPIVTAFDPKPPAKAVFKFATDTVLK